MDLLTLLGVTVIISTLVSNTAQKDQCPPSEGIMRIQAQCQQPNTLFLDAFGEHNKEKTCEYLFLLMDCVALKVPSCFDLQMNHATRFFHSPFNCNVNEKMIVRWQDLSKDGKDSLPHKPTSSNEREHTTKPDLRPQPWTHGQGVDPEGSNVRVGKGGSDHGGGYEHETDSNSESSEGQSANKGTKESHTGSDKDTGVHLITASIWALLLLVSVSRSLSWRLVS